MADFDYAAKIRGLLAMAESAEQIGNDHEAAAFRAKAQEWMNRYRVAEEGALAEDPASIEPTHVNIDFYFRSYEVSSAYLTMAASLARHCEIRINIAVLANMGYRITAVGYEGDLRYFEFLWTSAHLMFATKIDAHWQPERSVAENIFFMRQAGIKRAEIADAAGWDGRKAADRSKVQRQYLAEAARRGEAAAATGLGFQAKDYRRAYADAFTTRLERRLREARDAANSVGGVVVLSGRADRVDEAFYLLFPKRRPSTEVVASVPTKECERCAKAKSGACRQHPNYRWTAAMEARWQRQQYGASASAGRASGRQAADGVVLRGTASPTAKRVEASNRALEG